MLGSEHSKPHNDEYRFSEYESTESRLGFSVVLGGPGRVNEYSIRLEGYGHENYIPQGVSEQLRAELGDDWLILNRGSRLEVIKRTGVQPKDDELIYRAIELVLTTLDPDLR